MFETPKKVKRDNLEDKPTLAEYCDVEGCNRLAVIYVKKYNVSRCAVCYQRDIDQAGASASQPIVDVVEKAISI